MFSTLRAVVASLRDLTFTRAYHNATIVNAEEVA
jgi:hypothetical protein